MLKRLKSAEQARLHLILMLVLTFSTGVIDAVGYLGLDRVFTGNMTGNVVILGVALITSKGAHGVPGSAIVILAATLAAIPAIPAIGLVLVLSVDWFMGIARAVGNYIGNCVATVVVAAWVGDIDRDRARRILNGEEPDGFDLLDAEPEVPLPEPRHV